MEPATPWTGPAPVHLDGVGRNVNFPARYDSSGRAGRIRWQLIFCRLHDLKSFIVNQTRVTVEELRCLNSEWIQGEKRERCRNWLGSFVRILFILSLLVPPTSPLCFLCSNIPISSWQPVISICQTSSVCLSTLQTLCFHYNGNPPAFGVESGRALKGGW